MILLLLYCIVINLILNLLDDIDFKILFISINVIKFLR